MQHDVAQQQWLLYLLLQQFSFETYYYYYPYIIMTQCSILGDKLLKFFKNVAIKNQKIVAICKNQTLKTKTYEKSTINKKMQLLKKLKTSLILYILHMYYDVDKLLHFIKDSNQGLNEI